MNESDAHKTNQFDEDLILSLYKRLTLTTPISGLVSWAIAPLNGTFGAASLLLLTLGRSNHWWFHQKKSTVFAMLILPPFPFSLYLGFN